MLFFVNDYCEGAHPAILQKLLETNMEKLSGYGTDKYCDSRLKSQICLIGGNGFVCNFTRVLFFLLASGASVLPAANSYLIIDFPQISVYSCL